jgi:hypothetical protein
LPAVHAGEAPGLLPCPKMLRAEASKQENISDVRNKYFNISDEFQYQSLTLLSA